MTDEDNNIKKLLEDHKNSEKSSKRRRRNLDSLKMFLTQNEATACCSLILVTVTLLIATVAQCTSAQIDALAALDAPQQPPPSSLLYEEVLVQPNTRVKIECKIPTSQKSSSYWNFLQRTAGKEAKPHLLYFGRVPVYQGKPDFNIQLDDDPETGDYDLVINNATYELNDGIYYCDYQDPESKHIINREFRLTVLIAPQQPSIQPVTQAPAREGQEHQLQCQSIGGNPEPNITWFRNDLPIGLGPLGLRLEKTHANGSSTSTLSWIPTMDDNGAVYKCLVWNKAIKQNQPGYEREFRLQVEYAPRISVGPYNPLRVLVGQQVTLPCIVDANPPVKGTRWLKDGHLISHQYNHSIAEIKISDSGVYTCQADNGIPPLSSGLIHTSVASLFNPQATGNDAREQKTSVDAQLHLQVLYPPRVSIESGMPRNSALNEGDSIGLNCSVNSWPPAHEFIWTKQEDPTFRRQTTGPNSVLELHQVSAGDMGNYTCTAINRMEPSGQTGQVIERQGSASLMLYVKHRPGQAELVAGNGGVTELGTKTLIQCQAKPPGYPDPHYKIWKYAGNSQNKVVLSKKDVNSYHTLLSAKPDDEARYGCLAYNNLGESSHAEAELIVQEPPIIILDHNRRAEDIRPVGDKPYSITFRAYGKPEPKVTWYHRSPIDGRRIELSHAEMRNKFHIKTVSTQENQHLKPKYQVITELKFIQPLTIEDRGRYTVEFSNGLSKSAIEHFQLHINHAPIPVPRNGLPQTIQAPGSGSSSSLVEMQRWKAGYDVGETVNLTCRVSAYPKPDFMWVAADGNTMTIDNNPRYRMSIENTIDDIWESTLTFDQAQTSDYGDYVCSTANQADNPAQYSESVKIIINLNRKTTPDAPRQPEALDATQDSVTLQWIPGFDGGFQLNTFVVQYAPDDGSGQSLIQRYGKEIDRQAEALVSNDFLNQQLDSPLTSSYPKLYECLAMNPCTINNLLARQAYIFRVKAKNELGSSDFSEELKAQTRANISQIPRILDASFDTKYNVLHFRVEPGSDFPYNSLNARIEVRSTSHEVGGPQEPGVQEISGPNNWLPLEWRHLSTVLIRQERAEAYLNVQHDTTDQLRVTLCSRTNESLCGPESIINLKTAASSFLHAQTGLSLSIMMSTLVLIVLIAAFATSVHSCCFTRKDKKTASIERADGNIIDNKPVVSNGVQTSNGHLANGKSSHGSTTSTNSTSANGASTNGLQSIDSINGAINSNGGSASDHSSDHSRQAKLDSMMPPNYNHYADRASIMMEQQMMQQQQQGLLAEKMNSPFGLPNSALLSVANQQPSPMFNGGGTHQFNYGQGHDSAQFNSMQMDHHTASMMNGGGPLLMGSGLVEQADGQQHQAQMWPGNSLDDYDYNTLAYNNASQLQQQQPDPTYGTTGSVIMSPQSAAYDNNTNSTSQHIQSYLSAYQPSAESAQQYQQQRAQYQQEIAVAQQQMYGTLTRNGYATGASQQQTATTSSQNNTQDQQQQLMEQQYQSTSGLMQQPPPPPQVQESDYGTTGARSGRVIREIIV